MSKQYVSRCLAELKSRYEKKGITQKIAVSFQDNEITFYFEDGRGNGDEIFTIPESSLISAIPETIIIDAEYSGE